MLKIRRSRDRVIFNIAIPISGTTVFILRRDPAGVAIYDIHSETYTTLKSRENLRAHDLCLIDQIVSNFCTELCEPISKQLDNCLCAMDKQHFTIFKIKKIEFGRVTAEMLGNKL